MSKVATLLLWTQEPLINYSAVAISGSRKQEFKNQPVKNQKKVNQEGSETLKKIFSD